MHVHRINAHYQVLVPDSVRRSSAAGRSRCKGEEQKQQGRWRDPIALACTLPGVGFGFVGHAFERCTVGFVVSLPLLRIALTRLFLMLVPTTHALRVSADRPHADGESKKHDCGYAFHVRTRNPASHGSRIESN